MMIDFSFAYTTVRIKLVKGYCTAVINNTSAGLGDGSRGAEVSTKELAARGAEKVVPIGDSYRLQVEYQQLAAQKAELLVPRGFPLVTRRSN